MIPSPRIGRRERGVGIVTAIFLLVVLAGLGVAMVALYTSQQASSNLDLQGARAYQAARAGMEWGLYQKMRKSQCSAATKLAMPAGTSLSPFIVVVACGGGTTALAPTVVTAVACNIADSDGNCNCDLATGATGTCKPSTNPETVNRKVEVQL
jgi:MSHA biogenesis protein MshP